MTDVNRHTTPDIIRAEVIDEKIAFTKGINPDILPVLEEPALV